MTLQKVGVVVLVLTMLLLARIALAAPKRDPWARTKEQGAMIARIIVNERSEFLRGDPADPVEIDWFFSTVVNNRVRYPHAGWSGVLAALAPHVTMSKPPTRHRQEWTSGLAGCSERKPAMWLPTDGNWEIYALRWQSLCLDIQERWVRGEWLQTNGVIAWGNLQDAKRHVCAKARHQPLCLAQHFPGGNLFFAVALGTDEALCDYAAQEELAEAVCAKPGRKR